MKYFLKKVEMLPYFLGSIIRTLKILINILRHIGRKICGLPALRNVEIALTYDCQCKCRHCFSREYKRISQDYLSITEIERILKECAQLGAFHVNFTGGEPLLREDIKEIIKVAKRNGYIVSLVTNGLRFKDIALDLKDSGIDIILFSLDSADKKTHDENRGVKTFDHVIKGIKIAKTLGILTLINYTLTHRSFKNGEIEKMYELSKNLGVFLNLVPPVFIGGLKGSKQDYLNELDRIKFFRFLFFRKIWSDILSGFWTGCDAGKEKIGINPYGFVTPCPAIPEIFGNCRKEKIRDIWARILKKNEYSTLHDFCYANLKTNPRNS